MYDEELAWQMKQERLGEGRRRGRREEGGGRREEGFCAASSIWGNKTDQIVEKEGQSHSSETTIPPAKIEPSESLAMGVDARGGE